MPLKKHQITPESIMEETKFDRPSFEADGELPNSIIKRFVVFYSVLQCIKLRNIIIQLLFCPQSLKQLECIVFVMCVL